MRVLGYSVGLLLLITPFTAAQSPQAAPASAKKAPATATPSRLEAIFEDKVKTEWEAFKTKDKNAYADLLAEDFAGVEDDNQGMRTKKAATGEIDRSVLNNYNVFALKVLPLNDQAALVTYELTMLFPPKSAVRIKRVMVAELWLKREGQWKLRYYQETHVR
jgi:hypothetical protein